MKDKPGRIGIDIGAVSLKAVRLGSDAQVVKSFYARHRGDPAKALETAMAELSVGAGDAIGFCGSYTTFSSYAFESFSLFEQGHYLLFAGNVLSNNLLCLAGVLAGAMLARSI